MPGSHLLAGDGELLKAELRRMGQEIYLLDERRRDLVLGARREVCERRRWILLAAQVRTNHVHTVVEANAAPERVMNDFKVQASRRLNEAKVDEAGRKRWARHGSTRWLWSDQDVRECVRYVVEEQGSAMAVFVGEVP